MEDPWFFVFSVHWWRFEFAPERISPASVSDYALINQGFTEHLPSKSKSHKSSDSFNWFIFVRFAFSHPGDLGYSLFFF